MADHEFIPNEEYRSLEPKKHPQESNYGDEAPSLKQFLIVLLAIGILIAASWIGYYKLGWFH